MSSRIALVDALRGLAALVVLWHHVTALFPQALPASPAVLAVAMWISDRNVEAVLMFFVLSGFSIRLSVRKLDMHRRDDRSEYFYRRFRRILPLYGLSLLVAGVVGWSIAPARPSSLALSTLLGNLAFLQTAQGAAGTWFEPFAQNGPLWSLSYEMFYYLVFPPLLLLANTKARLLVAIGLTVAGIALQQVFPNPIASFAASFLIWYLGAELAELYLTGRASVPWWCISLLGLCIVAVLSFRASATLRSLAVGVLFFHVGYALIATRSNTYSNGYRAMERLLIAPLAWVGSFSYGLYLLHYPILRAVAALSSSAAAIVLGVLGAAIVAYIAETRTVHRELRWLRRRYI